MKWLKLIFPILALIIAFNSCKKNEFNTDSSAMLEFSKDTMVFDTVFTTIGTTTEFLKIYNRDKQAIEVSSIRLARGSSSQFRINVDGISGIEFENVEVPAEDSLFIFVEATIDPNMIDAPLIVTDSILFETNGNLQDVDLVAWGQDAHFFYGEAFAEGFPDITCLDGPCDSVLPCADITWPNDKPYVIYGYLVLDSCDKLTIEPGVQIHFHQGSGLWVYEYGQIIAEGNVDDPIIFQGDRPESAFDEIPGQWDRIWINQNDAGLDNKFTHCIIKNNFLGIQAEPLVLNEDQSLGPGAENKLILNSVITRNNSGAGLLLKNYNVEATNCLFANAGQSTVAINGGGEYNFNFCTFGNYWSFGTRNTPSFFVSNTYQDPWNIQVRSIENSQVTNSIIYGNSFDEVAYVFDNTGGALSDIIFDKVLVKIDEVDVSDNSVFTDILINQNPEFIDPSEGDFQLESFSPCIDKPNSPFAASIGIDIEENPLTGNGRDWGCYEYQP